MTVAPPQGQASAAPSPAATPLAATSANPTQLLIKLFGDPNCIWTYITRKSLDCAVEQAQRRGLPLVVTQRWYPYLLDAKLTPGNLMCRESKLRSTMGPAFEQKKAEVQAIGQYMGLDLKLAGTMSCTWNAQRLLHYSFAVGGEPLQTKLLYAVLSSLHTKALIATDALLAELAVEAGMFEGSHEKAAEWLASNAYSAETEQIVAIGREHFVGSPVTVFMVNGAKFCLTGAQKPQSILEVLQRIVSGKCQGKCTKQVNGTAVTHIGTPGPQSGQPLSAGSLSPCGEA